MFEICDPSQVISILGVGWGGFAVGCWRDKNHFILYKRTQINNYSDVVFKFCLFVQTSSLSFTQLVSNVLENPSKIFAYPWTALNKLMMNDSHTIRIKNLFPLYIWLTLTMIIIKSLQWHLFLYCLPWNIMIFRWMFYPIWNTRNILHRQE